MPDWVSIIILILVVIFIVWKLIDWKEIAYNWIGYNPKKCVCYVRSGGHIRPYLGVWDHEESKADIYKYKTKKGIELVTVPKTYPHDDIYGRRVIGVENGVIYASPLGSMSAKERGLCVANNNPRLLSDLWESHVWSLGLRSMKTKKAGSMITWLIIAAVVVGGLILLNKNGLLPFGNNQPISQTTEQTAENTGQIPAELLRD
jgi:hypothetical protein